MTRPRPAWRPPPRQGVNASCVAMPHGSPQRWPTVWHFLCERLPVLTPDAWAQRLAQGDVLDADGQPVAAEAPCRPPSLLWYWREVPQEPDLPVTVDVLFQDEHLVVADKPHGMAISPTGRHARETVQARLQRQLGLDSLSPIHRLDRDTAGVVVFSVQPAERQAYQALFSLRQVEKTYESVAPWQPGRAWPLRRESRIVPGAGPMQMVEVPGAANACTDVDWLAHQADWAWYRLWPRTGRTHQLRVHMLGLGLPLRHDRIYPVLWPQEPLGALPALAQPLQLLARSIAFRDPITGAVRDFSSQRALMWPALAGAAVQVNPRAPAVPTGAAMSCEAPGAPAFQVLPRGTKA